MIRKPRYRSLQVLKQLHGQIVTKGFGGSDLLGLGELLIGLVSLRGAMEYAYKLFERIAEPDVFTWNTMIRGAAHSSKPSDAISLSTQMKERGACPDSFTFIFLLKACTRLSSGLAGAQIHGMIVRLGLESDAFVRNALVNMHANCGDLAIAIAIFNKSTASEDAAARSSLIAGYARRGHLIVARRLFDEAETKDLVSWNIMISAYAKNGEMDKAKQVFDEAPQRDNVSWNAVIAGYVSIGSHEQALRLFQEMQLTDKRPDEATIVSLLSSCAACGSLDLGWRIHQSITMGTMGSKTTGRSLLLSNALVDMYAKCGSTERAMQVFRGMREKDIWTWNSIIGGLALQGHATGAIELFEEMREVGVKPNEITFINVLTACSHGGMILEGRRCFSMMRGEYGMEPSVKHYGCMIDMLGRAGLVEEAFELTRGMEMEANSVIWKALLAACQAQGNVKLGEYVSERLRKTTSGDHVLLSNMYSSAGEWQRSEWIRRSMDANGVRKEAARTLIQLHCPSLPQIGILPASVLNRLAL